MNYSNYLRFRKLSEVEKRLFDEGYWEVGFVDSEDEEIPIVKTTLKWLDMMDILLSLGINKIITLEQVLAYLDDPKAFQKNYKRTAISNRRYVKKDGSVKRYKVKKKLRDAE